MSERAWLAAHPDIRVAIAPDYPPISFLDSTGQPTGLESDYLTLIEARLQVNFKRVIPSLAQRADNTPAGKGADMLAIFSITDVRLQSWLFTKTYLDFPVYLITRQDAPIAFSLENTQKQRISVVGQYASYQYLKEHFPNVLIDKVDDTCIGLQRIALGQSAGMLADLPVANWCAKKHNLKNLKIGSALGFHYEMGLAVRKDWPVMQSILEKGLAAVSQQERDDIYLKWNKNSLEKSVVERYSNWFFAGIFLILSGLMLRFFQWDKKLKASLDNRLNIIHFTDSHVAKFSNISKKVMRSNVIAFSIFVILIFASFAYIYQYYETNHSFFVQLLEFSLICACLIGGFTLGSIRRRFEADTVYNQLLGQTSQRKKVELQLSAIEERQAMQQQALVALTKNQLRDWQDPEDVYREIVQIAANTLQVDRVSIWLFSDSHQQLDCLSLYLKSQNQFTIAQPLQVNGLPIYFNHLLNNRVLVANDVHSHPATVEFGEDYLKANHIGAMLDGTIWLNNKVVGVICAEHTGGSREWTIDEQTFVGSLTDYCRIIIETCKRRDAEQALIQQSLNLEQTVAARTRSLIESDSRYSYIVQNAPIPIVVIGSNGNIVDINPEALLAGKFLREQVVGKSFIETIVAKESRRKAFFTAAQTLKGKNFRDVELTLQASDGKKVVFLCSIGTITRAETDGTEQMVAIAQDISQQKALQATLVKAREAAESADRIKSMFVASMSHELRTPLNSIIGFLGVVLQGMSGELNVKQKDQLGRAYHSSKHLLSLISDVIDISKIEAGFLHVHAERFELLPLLEEVEHAVQHLVIEKHLTIDIECASKLWLETDRKRLYQVVLNVVSNAVKYTERGSVNVRATLENNHLMITTKDTGIGIDENGLVRLFNAFERIESPLKIKTLGTGLGLYLTRKILSQLLGGTIDVKSKLGVGSTVMIKLPVKMTQMVTQNATSILENEQS